jgi:rhodanese-related sulfurtransferase
MMIVYLCAIALQSAPAADADVELASPYCGLYCVQAAGHALNRPCAFDVLLDNAYLNAPFGSTAADLCRALVDIGLNGKVVGNMTTSQLRMTNTPVILHVRAPGATGYRHWILFLGFEGRRIQIYDPPRAVSSVTLEDLLSIWDGIGIVTSVPPDRAIVVDLPVDWLVLVLLCGLLLWALGNYRRKALALLTAVVFVVGARHALFPGGFVGAGSALDNVIAAHFRSTVQEIGYEQFETLRKRPDSLVVDARLPSSYRTDHIPGAINVPPALGISALNKILGTIPKDRHLLLYCQSLGCHWSEEVAQYFLPRGYRRVCIYRGGMNDWRERRTQQAIIPP